MSRWFTLFKVELYKLITRKITWILLAYMILLPALTVVMNVIIRNVTSQVDTYIESDEATFDEDSETSAPQIEINVETETLIEDEAVTIERSEGEAFLQSLKESYEGAKAFDDYDPKSPDALRSEANIAALEAHLENGNLETAAGDNLNLAMFQNTPFNTLMIILSIIIGLSIANEYQHGTMKQMVTRPFKRTTILTTKYAAALLYALIALIVHYLAYFLIRGAVFGFDLRSVDRVFMWGDTPVVLELLPHALLMHVATWLSMALVIAIAACIGVWTRSTAGVIGFTLALCFLAAPIINSFSMFLGWFSVLPTAFIDLRPAVSMGSSILQEVSGTDSILGMGGLYTGASMSYGLTSPTLLLGWFVYLVLFLGLAIFGINKRDI